MKMRKMNDKAQWQIIEVFLVAGMLFLTVYIVKSFDVTVYRSIGEKNSIESWGDEVLASMASQPDNITGQYPSLLAYYIMQDHEGLEDYINKYFSANINFKVELLDVSSWLKKESTGVDYTEEIITPDYWIKEEAKICSRIVVIDKVVYEVILSLWFNIAG